MPPGSNSIDRPQPPFRMVDSGWAVELGNGVRVGSGILRIVCPFIKERVIDWLLKQRPKQIKVNTRFNLGDFADGASDIAALRKLLDFGASVRGIRDLHAKVYLFGTRRAIVTSANLTEAGLSHNPEFGMIANEKAVVAACRNYFDRLWHHGRSDLGLERLVDWDHEISRYLATGTGVEDAPELADHGADAGMDELLQGGESRLFGELVQAIVKFLGDSSKRPAASSLATLDEIKGSGCHRVVGYPVNKRPGSVVNGATVFIARLVDGDTRVFGRAVALKHQPGRDDATPRDLKLRPWRTNWPRYVRIHHAEFVAGTMENGVSLGEMMDKLKADSFVPTQQNAARGDGNTNPRLSIRRQAAARLTNQSYRWLSRRLQEAFEMYGKVKEFEWPKRGQPEFPVDWWPEQSK